MGRQGSSPAMRMIVPAAMLILGLCLGSRALAGDAKADAPGAIRSVLEASAADWSKGDLAAFMRCYENSPQTSYLKRDGIVRGYDAIRAMYAARFGGTPGTMGLLSLEMLDFRALGEAYALVTGRFRLAGRMPAHPDATGLFTLVFHKSAAGWGIISDHTS